MSRELPIITLALVCMLNSHESASAQLNGTATYRERIAMPADAVFETTLEDVSKADAPADGIGRARIEKPGNVPIRFEIPYDTSRIVQSHRYMVRARILSGGKPFFMTDQSYPVLTQGAAGTCRCCANGRADRGQRARALGR